MKRHHLFLLIGCLLLASWGCQKPALEEKARGEATHVLEVDVVPVSRHSIESSIELTGTLYPWKFATIASEVTGVVQDVRASGEKIEYEIDGTSYSKVLPLDIGHQVKKGDVLIKIESSDLEHALLVAKAKKVLMEKELANLFAWKRVEEIDQLKAQCEECDAVLLDAREDLTRAESLLQRRATSQKEVDDATRSVATALAAKKRNEAALKLANAGPTPEQIAVAKAQVDMAQADVDFKRVTLDKCTIRCPLETASIVERYVGVGDHVTVNPSTPLMRLIDAGILMAQVHVPERFQGLIQVNDRASVSAQGGRAAELNMGQVDAMVVLVNAQVDPDTRTFRIRVGIDNSRNLFKAGTFVKVRIPLHSIADAVVVPNDAITFSKGDPSVFVVKNGVIDRIPVELGIANRTHYQVVSGLTESDLVVRGDLSLLAPGLQVKPRTVNTDSSLPTNASSSATRSQG